MNGRRNFFRNIFSVGAGVAAASKLARGQRAETESTAESLPVRTPDIKDLPFSLDNGVKVFHLIAEPVKQEILPGKTIDLWGYNGSAPGPTIQVNQGDRVRIVFDNHLPEPTSMHWHGFEIPNEMDGAPGSSQDPVKPGGRFVYEFTLHQEGTYFYHPHMAMQEMIGMLGAFIMHPSVARAPRVDRDFVIMLQEYAILPNISIPNTMNMEFNWLTFNGKAGPAITPLIVRLGDRVRVRLINLGMDHHPIHLHGHTFFITGTEGGPIPQTLWYPGNTVLVGVAQARDFEFVANNPGDWMLHCHMPHHMMNQMTSTVGPMTRLGKGMPAGAGMEAHNMPGMDHGEMKMNVDVSPDANSVPGFPQDAFMSGPMMAMDQMVAKPENDGLRPGWSGFIQGMMTFVRVLPPDQYQRIMDLKAAQQARRSNGNQGSGGRRHGE
ncbi:MAG TPA: multicopper oxidase domain-containing protein [Bryobacteraceae bacterium]|nr:multicopper oxidase domain-containing protein [Bryobacteraceae bacterium]